MASRFDKFTKAYRESRIPFALLEVVTDGGGEMVDLQCRFVNAPAAALLETTPDALQGQRLRQGAVLRLEDLRPLAEVAFSGSSVSFLCQTALGRALRITCYQPVYGAAACILEEPPVPEAAPPAAAAAQSAELPVGTAVIEVGRSGVRCLSFNRRLCELSRWSRKEFLNRFADDLSRSVEPEDWPELLQALQDGARSGQGVVHQFRLLRRTGGPLWLELRAERVSVSGSAAVFRSLVLNVDPLHRGEEALREAQARSDALQSRLEALAEAIPGGWMAGTLSPEGTLVPLQVNAALCELAGYPEAELLRHMTSDPLWRLHPDDRPEMESAWQALLGGGEPVRRTVRLRRRGGAVLWAEVTLSLLPPEEGGSRLVLAGCRDITQERRSGRELQLFRELCGLLLARSGVVSWDYDVAADTARFEFFGPGGSQSRRTVPEYLRTLSGSAAVHPDSRKVLRETLERASSRPERGEFEYLGNYDGDGWRRYRASFVSLADESGSVCRIVGQAEDVTAQTAAEARFRGCRALREGQAKQSLVSLRLDLTADRPLSAASNPPELLRTLFGNTAEECLAHLRESIPDEGERARFLAAFSRERLLAAFSGGADRFALTHRFAPEGRTNAWVRTAAELAENPVTRHVEADFFLTDVTGAELRRWALDALADRACCFLLLIDPASRHFRCCGGRFAAALPPAGEDFYKAALSLVDARVPAADRRHLRSAILLPGVVKKLNRGESPETVFRLNRGDGSVESVRCRFHWLDDTHTRLVLFGWDVTGPEQAAERTAAPPRRREKTENGGNAE